MQELASDELALQSVVLKFRHQNIVCYTLMVRTSQGMIRFAAKNFVLRLKRSYIEVDNACHNSKLKHSLQTHVKRQLNLEYE